MGHGSHASILGPRYSRRISRPAACGLKLARDKARPTHALLPMPHASLKTSVCDPLGDTRAVHEDRNVVVIPERRGGEGGVEVERLEALDGGAFAAAAGQQDDPA